MMRSLQAHGLAPAFSEMTINPRPPSATSRAASAPHPLSGSRAAAASTVSLRAASWQELQEKKNMWEIREGLRVTLLGATPAPVGTQKVWPIPKKERVATTQEEALTIYAFYRDMLEMDDKAGANAQFDDDLLSDQDAPPSSKQESSADPKAESGISWRSPGSCDGDGNLRRVSWRSFLTWAKMSK